MSDIVVNLLHFFFMGIGFGGVFWALTKLKGLFIWLKGGIEDGDGILENKELTIAFFSLLAAFIVISIPVIHFVAPASTFAYPDSVILGVFALAGAAYAANRASDAYKNGNGNGKSKSLPKEEDEATF